MQQAASCSTSPDVRRADVEANTAHVQADALDKLPSVWHLSVRASLSGHLCQGPAPLLCSLLLGVDHLARDAQITAVKGLFCIVHTSSSMIASLYKDLVILVTLLYCCCILPVILVVIHSVHGQLMYARLMHAGYNR